MNKLFAGSYSDQLVLWQKVCRWLNIIGLPSMILANAFKKALQPYNVVISVYLILLLLIWIVAIVMLFTLKRKIKLDQGAIE